MVSDTGGLQDHSFNYEAYAGMQQAAAVNKDIRTRQVTAPSSADYLSLIDAYASADCDLVVAAGVAMTEATRESAKKHSGRHYALVDGKSAPPNVKGVQINAAQSAFLAGYLAAAMTKTGTVGTFGGADIESVKIKMDGFWEGVAHYNTEHRSTVRVLGWDEPSQRGTLSGNFNDPDGGRRIAADMRDNGADVILAVAGSTGKGALDQALASSGKLAMIWTESDGYITNPDHGSVILTSILRDVSSTVSTVVSEAAAGRFDTTPFIGDLANHSTDLAPFHDYTPQVPASLINELTVLRQAVINGSIKITSPNQPS
ncbi:BMP family ABC transporter substrate-binding protein (plasmid) [Kitasatospora sp. NBC_00070]|uniref:BMP family lipoprotein n=1 Tax=Kitasatospora sp. NBC_00070 TaxID=2975962 RepID=UPI0032502B9A